LALVVSAIGSLEPPVYVAATGGTPGASMTIYPESGEIVTSIGGSRIPLAVPPTPHPDLQGADRDLALRIVNSRPLEFPWWSLGLSAQLLSRGNWMTAPKAEGMLSPLLVSSTGEIVAAVWTSSNRPIRWYVLPYMPSYVPILHWLSDRAIPEFVPSAARRVRASLSTTPELLTSAEAHAANALATLEAEYERRHAELLSMLGLEMTRADEVRDPILFGTGSVLVSAVKRIFEDAGLDVVDLDELFGDTISADLLVALGIRRVLVEVKSSAGSASERETEPPARHLNTWPKLKPDWPVEGVVLVFNHQTRSHPLDRSPEPYSRAPHITSLTFPVVATRRLFDLWRVGDLEGIRKTLFGE
jgi:hypothetical protein